MSSSAATESSPLLPTHNTSPQSPTTSRNKPQRNVTFSSTVLSQSPPLPPQRPAQPSNAPSSSASGKQGKPVFTALNSKLRRRNSSGSALIPQQILAPASKIGPQRTTKNVQKLKLLPNPEQGEEAVDYESGRDVYAQLTRLKDPRSRRDAARLGKDDKERLPRVTAYCTAGSYRIEDAARYMKGKAKIRHAAPKLFDECMYSPYSYTKPEQQDHASSSAVDDVPGSPPMRPQSPASLPRMQERRFSDSAVEVENHNEERRDNLIDIDHPRPKRPSVSSNHSATPIEPADLDTTVHIPEVFLFQYGTVVIWGMTEQQELKFLREMSKFEEEKLSKDDVQLEDFNFYYTHEYQARIYNDFIALNDKKNYMLKLAISHALSQSVKTSLYEDLVDRTIDVNKGFPSQIAKTGKVSLSRRAINMQIGELFCLRIEIHLQGSVLDAPELMWAEPHLEPVYQTVRSYLEVDQRASLLTERLDVIADLLAVLKDQLTVAHGELLELIVIILIAAEIFVAAVNILVDTMASD